MSTRQKYVECLVGGLILCEGFGNTTRIRVTREPHTLADDPYKSVQVRRLNGGMLRFEIALKQDHPSVWIEESDGVVRFPDMSRACGDNIVQIKRVTL